MLSTGSSSRWRSSTVSEPDEYADERGAGTAQTKSRIVSAEGEVRDPRRVAATAVRRRTSADASLTRLSPSSTAISRGGRPARRPIAVAATASVGLTTAPRAVASAKEMLGKTQCTTAPIASAETITITTESQVISEEVAAYVDHREVDRRGVEQRRQHAGQDQLRLDVDRRRTGQVARPDAEPDEQQRGRDAGAPGEDRRRDHDREPGPGDQRELVVHQEPP